MGRQRRRREDEAAPVSRQLVAARSSDRAGAVPDVRGGVHTLSQQNVLTLQRLAGNRAVSALIMQDRPVVQRDDELEEGVNRLGGGIDTANTQIGQWGGVGAFGQSSSSPGMRNYELGGTSLESAKAGEASAGIGIGTSLTSTVLSSMSAERGRQRRNAAVEGTAEHRAGTRDLVSGATTATQSAYGVASNVTSVVAGVGGIQSMAGSTSALAGASGALGAGAGVVALPLSAFTTGRTIRKAHKQRLRWEALKKVSSSQQSAPKEALAAKLQEVDALTGELAGHQEDLADAQARRARIATVVDENTPRRLAMIDRDIAATQALIDNTQNRLDFAKVEEGQLTTAKEAADRAVQEAAARAKNPPADPTLEDIQAYAMSKNKAGLIKKVVGAVGGLLSVGGGVAGTIAAFAAIGATGAIGAAAVATPIGWALCGGAALIGLGLAGLAAWKFFSKRWARSKTDDTGRQRGKLERLGVTLKFWKKVGKSRREIYAEKLYEMAFTGAGPRQAQARETIAALGLDWRVLKMDEAAQKAASIELITAKLAS